MAGPNGTAHGKDDLLHHSQSQTAALSHIAASLITPIKAFKDFRQISVVDAAAVIGKGQRDNPLSPSASRDTATSPLSWSLYFKLLLRIFSRTRWN